MAEHLLDAPEIGASLEQVCREGVTQEMRMDAARLEPCLLGQPPENEEGARAGQRPALGVQEELRLVAAVEERAAPGEIPAQGIDRAAAERDDALLVALAHRPHEPLVEVDSGALEADRLAHAKPGAVEELDEG